MKPNEPVDDESEFWRNVREVGKQQHAEWRDRINVVVKHKVSQLEARGHAIKWLTEWQFRVDDRYDIFWQSKRYHDIKLNRRGDYYDLISFIESKTHEHQS